MRKPSNRAWLELRKELGRSSNLVWAAALLIWLVLSSSRYTHFLHSKWLSATQHGLHLELLAPYPSSPFTFPAPLLELHDKSTDSSRSEGFLNSQDAGAAPGHGYDDDDKAIQAQSSEPNYDNEDHNNVIQAQSSGDEEALLAHRLFPALHPSADSDGVAFENNRFPHDSDFKERSDEILPLNDSQAIETSGEQGRFKPPCPQCSSKVQNFQQNSSSSNSCATVEEMGLLAASTVANASFRVREIIKKYFSQHGASHVRELPAKEFCRRGFVFGRATEDGLGNDIYKILTAAGLSIMLNRSLIIAEHGSVNPAYFGLEHRVRVPFGDYLRYSNETFSLSEVKRLWVKHDCAGEYRRPLAMIVDDFQRPTRTKVFCEDWTKWRHPIIWFKGTTDSNALQFFLKNQHMAMREPARLLFGDPSKPSSRPNVFGELFKAFISPRPVIEEAVNWALQGRPDPDVAIHLRMLNSRSRTALYAVCSCIQTVLRYSMKKESVPSVVVVSDTPLVIRHIKQQLDGFAQVIHFDYKYFMDSYHNLSKVMTGNYFQPPEKRLKDWGAMPRWVAIVDMFLAARARVAVISGANRRVGTTYAQLLASLAGTSRTDEESEKRGNTSFQFYSSFQPSLLTEGLAGQRGWGHVWRRFAGHLSCKNQGAQCAQTPLLSYAWWDGPWQSPAPRDIQRMLAYGIKLSHSGHVEDGSLRKICTSRKSRLETVQLILPSCKRLKVCRQ